MNRTGFIKIPTEMHPDAEIYWGKTQDMGYNISLDWHHFFVANGFETEDGMVVAKNKFKFTGFLITGPLSGRGQMSLEEVERDGRRLLAKREQEWNDFLKSDLSWPDWVAQFGVKWDMERGLPEK